MQVYILSTSKTISPFGNSVADVRILDTPLREWQRKILSQFANNIETIRSITEANTFPCLIVRDDVFFTEQFFDLVAKQLSSHNTESYQIGIGESYWIEEKAALGGLEQSQQDGCPIGLLPIFYLNKQHDLTNSNPPTLAPLLITIKEKLFIPDNIKILREDMELIYSLSSQGAMIINHWSHILDVNQAALLSYWMDFRVPRIAYLGALALRGAVSNLSVNPWSIASAINVIGKNCDIHPTAYVAGCIIGNNVSIGPNTSVVGCSIANGAKIEGLSDVFCSVIGEQAVVSFRTKINFTVMYPRSMASYPALQMCVLGERALHMGGCFAIDMKLSHGELHDVKVKHDGRIVNSGKKFLGLCMGHRSILGTGLWIQSGVEVPNDYLLVRSKNEIVTRIPEGYEEVPLSFENGELVSSVAAKNRSK